MITTRRDVQLHVSTKMFMQIKGLQSRKCRLYYAYVKTVTTLPLSDL
jgi:hypothetical protein